MKPITYSALKFAQGMTPKVFTPDAATRIEHFDTITEVLRPFRTMTASSVASTTPAVAKIIGLEVYNEALYGVGIDYTTPTYGALYKWENGTWTYMYSFGAASIPSSMLQAHSTYLFGLRNGTHLYRYDPALNTYSLSFYAISYSYFADAITHSKDGIMYFATDNKIHKVTSDGATASLALTLPNTNYRITSLCEQGNYLNIVGFDVKSGESSSLLWDRDTSVVDLTESYALGRDAVIHNCNLLGQTFYIQIREDSTNTLFAEKPVLVIKYLNGATPSTLYEFPLASCSIPNNLISAKYTSLDRFYFTAKVQFVGESSARNICFALDYKGRLTIAQNLDLNTGTNAITGVMRIGEGFWFGAGSDGAWNTTTTYTTVSAYETNDIRSEDLSMNLDFVGGTVTCEPMIAGAQILVKMRKNEETAFTTVETLSETNRAKFSVTAMKVKNALAGLDSARQVRIRLESTGGAVITGAQFIFNPVADKTL
jgi:hypothetical protein